MEREEVVRIAREKLGASGRFATGEYTMPARLLQGEEQILVMVIARRDGAGSCAGR